MMQKNHFIRLLKNFGNAPPQGEMNVYSIADFMVHGEDTETAPVL